MQQEHQSQSTTPSYSETLHLLIVDDNPADILLTSEAFRESGLYASLHIESACDGEVASDMLHKRGIYSNFPRPDLIVLDLNMPKKDGYDLLKEIKSNDALKSIAVIILSGSHTHKDIELSYALHANSYIIKPSTKDGFKHFIKSIDDFWFSTVSLPGNY